jgi:hypothetical protein
VPQRRGSAPTGGCRFTQAGSRPDITIEELIHYSYVGVDRVMECPERPPPTPPFTPAAFTGGGGTTPTGKTRVAFQMMFDNTDLEQYVKDHESGTWPPWRPELLAAVVSGHNGFNETSRPFSVC